MLKIVHFQTQMNHSRLTSGSQAGPSAAWVSHSRLSLPKAPIHTRTAHRHRLQVQARVFQTDQGTWVVTPRGPPKGVVHFLGGAFAGAAPQVVYSLFLEMLAESGYTVITTPYAVTFQHLKCASTVHEKFLMSVGELQRMQGPARLLVPEASPVFGVGHSNGALLHLLIGSYNPGAATSNVIISYNNKQVKDAIPIPGFLSNLAPTLQEARRRGFQLPEGLPTSAQLLQSAAALLPPWLQGADAAGQISKAALALDQLSMVVDEVGGGATDFVPTPMESREIIRQGYRVNPTLLVKFAEDTIDETPIIEPVLRSKLGPKGVTSLTLPGSHVTPCGADISLQPPGSAYNPMDATMQLLKSQSQADIRRLGRQVAGWLDAANRIN